MSHLPLSRSWLGLGGGSLGPRLTGRPELFNTQAWGQQPSSRAPGEGARVPHPSREPLAALLIGDKRWAVPGNTVLARAAPGAPGVLGVGTRVGGALALGLGPASLDPELPLLLACVRTLAEVRAGAGRAGGEEWRLSLPGGAWKLCSLLGRRRSWKDGPPHASALWS